MLKYWRIWLLLIVVFGGIFAVGFKTYPYGRHGVKIVYVSRNSSASGVLEQGMQITEVNGQEIKDVDDWEQVTQNVSRLEVEADGKEYSFRVNGTPDISVMEIDRTNLDFGLDLKGGTRFLLKPKRNVTGGGNVSRDTIQQIIATLKTRANMYGLREVNFYPVFGMNQNYIQVEAAGVGSQVVEELLSKQGRFEAKVIKPVYIEDNTAQIQLGEDKYPVSFVGNESIEVNGTVLGSGDDFVLEGVRMEYVNKTPEKLTFLADVYDGKDIELVYTGPERSGIVPQKGGYMFYFAVLISQDGAQRFAEVTSGIDTRLDVQTGEEYLDSEILLYMDREKVSELNIGADLRGKVVNKVSIQGTRATKEEAIDERLRLQTILRSGALPTGLEVVSRDIISPTLGRGFIHSALGAGLIAAIVVASIVFFRYRSLKVALPLLLIGLSEVIIILGVASINDSYIWGGVLVFALVLVAVSFLKGEEPDISALVGVVLIPLLGVMFSWTIDLAAIAGIIAAIGTGIDHQIIIADETIRGKKKEKIYTIKEKVKKAFVIIFGAAATTVAAMVPLVFLGAGLVKGFAITTTVGVLVGLLITRPAYGKVVEVLVGE